MFGAPACQRQASMRRSTTSRIWLAVTAAKPAPGSSRIASSSAVHEVRPVSSAATIEYGQPGTIWCLPKPRPKVWQKERSEEVSASGRSHGETSTASTSRPSLARGSGTLVSARRSRATSIRPWLIPEYKAPCPRRCSGASARSTRVRTGPSVHSNASHSSNRASLRAVRHAYNSDRNSATTVNASR